MKTPQPRTAPGDVLARRQIAHWRRVTARLQVLMNSGAGSAALADEAHALRRQCERLACALGQVAAAARLPRPGAQRTPPVSAASGES